MLDEQNEAEPQTSETAHASKYFNREEVREMSKSNTAIQLAKKLAEIEAAFACVDELEVEEMIAKLRQTQKYCKIGLQTVTALRQELDEILSSQE